MEYVLLALLLFLVVGSLAALEMENLLSAVIAIGVAGLGLSIVFLLLGAPDIAITQVVVEVVIVTVMIRLTGRTGRREAPMARRALPVLVTGGLVLLALGGFLIHVFLALPSFGSAPGAVAGWYLENAPVATGATNVVTAVLLDFRALDTLGEATVILCAVVGTIVILRRPARRTEPAPEPEGSGAQGEPPRGRAPLAPRELEHV